MVMEHTPESDDPGNSSDPEAEESVMQNDEGGFYDDESMDFIDVADAREIIPIESSDYVDEMDDLDVSGHDDGNIEENADLHDDSILTFTEHKGSVFTVDINNELDMAISGGEDDKGIVWDTINGKIIMECPSHQDSVVQTKFNHNGKLVASADMNGLIQVWKLDTQSLLANFDVGDLQWMFWHDQVDIIFAGTMEGSSWMLKVADSQTKVFPGQGTSCNCGKLFLCGKRLAVGYNDGSIKIWHLKEAACVLVGDEKGDTSASCIDVSPNGNIVAAGMLNGTVKVANAATGKLLHRLVCSLQEEDSIESVVLSDHILAAATLSGTFLIYEASSGKIRCQNQLQVGISRMLWATQPYFLFVTCLNGVISAFDCRDGSLKKTWTGHQSSVLDICQSRNGRKIITSSDDGSCKVFNSDF